MSTEDRWEQPPRDASLPRIEDLPLRGDGYDRERVREAFDAWERRTRELESKLDVLQTVDAFNRQAQELRSELSSLRARADLSGFGVSGRRDLYPPPYVRMGRDRIRPSDTVPRLALEAALLIAVAVVSAVLDFRWIVIVALMAGAWALVALAEWAASRRALVPVTMAPPLAPAPPAEELFAPEPATPPPAEPGGAEPQPDAWPRPESETMLGLFPEEEVPDRAAEVEAAASPESAASTEPVESAEPVVEASEPEPEPEPEALQAAGEAPAAVAEPDPAAEPEPAAVVNLEPQPAAALAPRRRFWQRRQRPEPVEAVEEAPWTPRHVRVVRPEPEPEREPEPEPEPEPEREREPEPEESEEPLVEPALDVAQEARSAGWPGEAALLDRPVFPEDPAESTNPAEAIETEPAEEEPEVPSQAQEPLAGAASAKEKPGPPASGAPPPPSRRWPWGRRMEPAQPEALSGPQPEFGPAGDPDAAVHSEVARAGLPAQARSHEEGRQVESEGSPSGLAAEGSVDDLPGEIDPVVQLEPEPPGEETPVGPGAEPPARRRLDMRTRSRRRRR